MRLGILGATGWLGQGLGLGLIAKGLWPADRLVLLNRSGKAGGYADQPVIWARDAADLCARADILVLSTRPEDFPPERFDAGGRLVISFMTAWTLAKLSARWPTARIVRAMPNGGASIGQSYTPWVAPSLSEADTALVARILSAMGAEDRVADESQLDYLTALSGSGPAYPALLAQAMLTDALARGLPQWVAERAVEAVICGSAPFLEGRMGSLREILDSFLSYRGVTAAGMAAAGPAFDRTMHDALAAAEATARAMGK
ncbi:NAD(P)-binding domain-containing protein [Tabrizicola sp. J26]|uniref:pyrroline-5-carboxylate reductase family protein n=1 Tax=Alitabrizicola rongguiensis TaxID=2909234 RepID=UPI001F385DB5|nr:pyrroline-5-carboxylate reductase dimerization domain-containing protein [Tabrizicola rongguiensis]MCF1708970.1 NAD(P)-binding domain-containing protein [Tabrizicola rongguiensis]